MSTETKSSTTFWSWVGKVATLVGLLYGLVQLLGVLKSPEYSIVAYGEHYDILFPDSFHARLDKLKGELNSDSIYARLPEKTQIRQYDLYQAINDYLVKAFPSELQNAFRDIESIWTFKIVNDGSKEVVDLNLEMPFSGCYLVQRAGQKSNLATFENTIPIGSLRPANELSVVVWSNRNAASYYEKDTRITHPNGLYEINYSVPVRGLAAWNERNYGLPLIYSVAALILILLGTYQLGVSDGSKSGTSSSVKTELSKEDNGQSAA